MSLKRSIKRVGLVLTVTLVCLVATLLPMTGAAADITLPEEFYGDVTINGLAAPGGTVIVAKIGGIERGTFTTTEAGKYGGSGTFDSRLIVAGEEAEIGKTITFWVNSVRANQTAIYEPGESKELNLSAQAYPLNAADIQITRALDYLRSRQQTNGSIGGFSISAWAVMAIAAGGEDPNTWTSGGNFIVAYLRDNASGNLDPNKATDWERSILAIVAAEANPRDFGGTDYVDTLLGFYDGNQMGDVTMLNDDFWGILALAAIGESQTIIQNIKNFIISNQNGDGGWGWVVGGNSDADNTAAAVSALVAAGESPSSQAITNALNYLKSQQQNNGGFVSEGTTNAAVDSWVINAITDVGQSPIGDEWRKSGNNPIGHLLSLQDTDGAFKWTATQRSNPEWMTAYALPALLGKSWPRDASPPTISNLAPSPGVSITTASPVIGASYSDTISGINETTARILLDGTDVTASATVTASGISHTPAGLTLGTHSVRVTVSDKAGNEASQNWSFQVVSGGGGGGGGGGTSPTPTLPPGTTDVSDVIRSDGVFTQKATAQSEDGKCVLTIDKNTKGLTSSGEALSQITIGEMETPPTPPEQSNVIGRVYDLGPDGATFDPPIDLTFNYDESLIPRGVAEKNLVVAMWDSAASKWVELEGIVDPETNTIRARVSHFTAFTILAHTRPASFTTSGLSITPTEVNVGQRVSITVLVTNTGDLSGSYEVSLKIDNMVVEKKEVTLVGGDSETINFSIIQDAVGTHTVNVGGLSGTFEVRAPQAPAAFSISDLSVSPAEIQVGENVNILVSVANTGDLSGSYEVSLKIDNMVVETKEVTLAGGDSEMIAFATTEDTIGTYTVNVDGLSGSFIVKAAQQVPSPAPPEPQAKPINWPILGGVIAGVIIVGLLIFFVARRTRY